MDRRIPTADDDGTVRLPSFEVPLSMYMSERAKRCFIQETRGNFARLLGEARSIDETRRVVDEYYEPIVKRALELYPVSVEASHVGGVRVDRVTPLDGVARQNRQRILVNLHGGGFLTGAGLAGLAESIPIASVGKISIVSLDYRMAPEWKFPAASEDVASVYEVLLESYRAQDIGIYGCSAGGLLAAEAVAWFQAVGLPPPGAVGIFCTGIDPAAGGDSSFTSAQLNGPFFAAPPPAAQPLLEPPSSYFDLDHLQNALAFPILDPAILSKFPPSLLITGTRDRFMSSAIYLHAQLCNAGVDARLRVWEGMWHGFLGVPDMPEAMEAYQEIVAFFDSRIGDGNPKQNLRWNP